MATGTTGTPWNIPFPRGSDTYALASDLMAMASATGRGISTVRADHQQGVTLLEAALAGKASTSDLAALSSSTATDVDAVKTEMEGALASIRTAYDIAVADGYGGTRTQWLESLVGEKGDKGEAGPYGGTAVTDPQVAALITNAGTETATAVERRYRRSLSVTEYGAAGDGATNDTPAINAAIQAVADQGGGEVFFPPGTYSAASDVRVAGGVHLRGASAGASKLIIPVGNSARNTIIARTTGEWIEDVTISDLGFEGRWEEFPSQVAANGLITIKFVRRLRIERCVLRNSRAFTLNINVCADVVIRDNVMENGTRDLCAVWGSPNVTITGNRLAHNDDDAISVSWEGQINVPPTRSQIIISENHLTDTGPIRTQVPSGAIISDNTLHRTRGMGIYLSIINAARANTGTGHSNIVRGNVIRDVIDRNWNLPGGSTDGTVNLRSYILIESNAPQTGGLASVPGQPSPTGAITDPYGSNYAVSTMAGNLGPIRMPHGVIVDGNICKRTLPAVAAYSDWGYGPGYSMNGWLDRPVTDRDLRGIGVRVSLPFQSLSITNNILEAGDRGVSFGLYVGATLSDRLAQGVIVQGNRIRDCLTAGVYFSQSGVAHQDVQVIENIIDCDPNHLASTRRAGGAWSASDASPVALNVSNSGGVYVARNVIQNAGTAILQGGAGAFQDIQDNLLYGDLASTAFDGSNRGVGTVPGIGHGKQWWYSPRGSDPAAADYGKSLGVLPRDAASMPTTGRWLAGMFVYSRATSAPGGKYALGWLRLTSGTGNTPGTDWTPVYTSTN